MPALKNQRHETFALHVVAGKSASDAYRLSGFKCGADKSVWVSASRLLWTDKVQARIAELRKKVEKIAVVDRAWILSRLRENVDRAMQVEPVIGRDGKETGEHVYAGAVANRALELLGKEAGMFVDRTELAVKSLDQLPESDLAAIIAEAERAEKSKEQVQ